jgi:hypothetical protein
MCKHDDGCNVPEGECSGACLKAAPPSVEALQKECNEQARLNGMGAERELALLAKNDLLTRVIDQLTLDLNESRTTNAAQAERIAELEAGLHKIYEIDDTGPMVFETENGRSYPAGLSKGKSAQIAKTLVVAKPQAGEKHD